MLRVGIIGCGDISNLNVQGYLHSQDTELVAVCDTDIKRAREKLERWGLRTIKIYEDYKKIIDHEDLDIVEILTPHHLHLPMTEYAAEAQVPGISVQKPMANTLTACDKMIEVCEKEEVTLKIYENFRFYPPFLKAKELLESEIIGEPLNFRINTIAPGGPAMYVDLNSLGWRRKIETCGGGPWVYDDGIHKFSMALWLMNQEKVEKVYAWIDYFTVVMDIPSYIFWKYPDTKSKGLPKYGTMEFTLAPNVYYPNNYYHCDEFIEISGTKGIMWLNQCTGGGNFLSKTPQFPPIVVYVDGEIKTFGEDLPRDWRYSFINSTEHFINVIKNGGTPICTGEQGKNLSIFAKMPFISNQRNKIVVWEEISSENEINGSCLVEEPKFLDRSGFPRFNRNVRKDLKKGITQGLVNTKFKYQYED
jgi:predicted dehydrogenase